MERNANPRPTKRVIVTIFHDNDGECRVEPREAWVRPGGTVEFRSRVGPLTVFVPTPTRAGRLFPRISAPLFPVPARGKTLTVSATKPNAPAVYTYAVYCHKDRTFARASFPRLVIL